jgi:hypothetical protein
VEDIITKVCTKCEIEKPIDEFGKAKNIKDGLNTRCFTCRREICLELYYRNKERYSKVAAERRLANIEKAKSKEENYRIKNKAWIKEKYEAKKGVYNANRARKYKENSVTRSMRLASNRQYLQSKSENVHPLHDVNLERELYNQAYDLGKQTGNRYDVDHIFPLSKGGPHWHLNMQVIPKKINAAKSGSLKFKHPEITHWTELPEKVLGAIEPSKLAKAYEQLEQET